MGLSPLRENNYLCNIIYAYNVFIMKKSVLLINLLIALVFILVQNLSYTGWVHANKNTLEILHQEGTPEPSPDKVPLIAPHYTVEKGHDADVALHFFEQRLLVSRFAKIQLNDAMKGTDILDKGDQIVLNLFEDVSHTAEVSRLDVNVNGTVTLVAGMEEKKGYVIISSTGKRTLGSIYIPSVNMYYKIISDPETLDHFLIEMDASDRDIIESGPPLIPEDGEGDPREQQRIREVLSQHKLGPDDPANIDVMIVYTPAARNWANNHGGGIANVVAQSMANAQLVLDNSETLMTVTLAHSSLVDYEESGSSGADLRRLTSSADNPWNDWNGYTIAGYMDEVHDWRDQYGADLTALFSLAYDTGGIAWLLTNRLGIPGMGFSMTRVQQAGTGYTHIHEMGHNMGLHHHKEQNFQPGPTNWSNWPENNWSAGWRWQGADDGYYCSVMTYSSGQYYDDDINHATVPYFSNPLVIHQGVPAGHPTDGDNVRTLREIKHIIAAYRTRDLPSLITKDFSNITPYAVHSGGVVSGDGGFPVTARGIVWSTSYNPSLTNNDGYTVDGEGMGAFTSKLSELSPRTRYYVRAYATNSEGTAYGTERNIDTPRDTDMYTVSLTVTNQFNMPVPNAQITITPGGGNKMGTPLARQTGQPGTRPATISAVNNPDKTFHASLSKPKSPAPAGHGDMGAGEWFYWDIGQNEGSIGIGSENTFRVASRWTPSDLEPFHGMDITRMRVYMNHEPAFAAAKIWQGPEQSELEEVYSQEMTTAEAQWVEVELSTPHPIDTGLELWFGWEVGDPGEGFFPAGRDISTAHDGKGNLVQTGDNPWLPLSEYNIVGNWNIHAYVEGFEPIILYTDENGMATFAGSNRPYGYGVEKDGYSTAEGSFTVAGDDLHLDLLLEADALLRTMVFNVDMSDVEGFDPEQHRVYVTGDMTGWAEPGTAGSLEMARQHKGSRVHDGALVYSAEHEVLLGELEYKYFSDAFGTGWDGGEWEGEPNRVVPVVDNMELDDIWGVETEYFILSLYATPPEGGTPEGGGVYKGETTVNVHARANPGFAFYNWTDAGNNVVNDEAGFEYPMPFENDTLTAHFKKLPTLTIPTVSDVGATTARLRSVVDDEGDAPVTDRGFIYSDGHITDTITTGQGTGEFIVDLEDLFPATVYHMSAYAVNEYGSSRTEEVKFYSAFEDAAQAISFLETHLLNYMSSPGITPGEEDFGVKSFDLTNDLMGEDMAMWDEGDGWFVGHYSYTDHRDPLSDLVSYTWHRYYEKAERANWILSFIDQVTGASEDKDNVKGQALAMRAFSHFQLVKVFSHAHAYDAGAPGIPYHTEPVRSFSHTGPSRHNKQPGGKDIAVQGETGFLRTEGPDPFYPKGRSKGILERGTVSDVYLQLQADLDEALSLLEELPAQAHRSHIDLAVAHGLRARVALAMEDWSTAAEHAGLAVSIAENHGKALCTPNDHNAGHFNTVEGSEWMWGSETARKMTPHPTSFFSHMDARFDSYASSGGQKLITQELYHAFPDTDVRKSLFIAPGDGMGDLVDYNQMKFLAPEIGSFAGDYLYMRLAEMYLIRAEALARAGDEDVEAQQVLYDLVSMRDPQYSQTETTGQELIDEILLHRRMELWGEGHRAHDIRRMQLPLERPEGDNHDPDLAVFLDIPANDRSFLWRIPRHSHLEMDVTEGNSVLVEGNPYESSLLVAHDAHILLEAIASEGYHFDYWMDEGGEILGYHPEYQLVMPAGDMRVTASFALSEYTLGIDAEPAEGGNVEMTPEQAAYNMGDTIDLEAIAGEGYLFDGWSGDTESLDDEGAPQATLTMPAANVALTANFALESYLLEVSVEPPASGSVSIDPERESFHMGDEIALTAIAADGFLFEGWSGDTELLDDPDGLTPAMTMPARDVNLKAIFAEDDTGIEDAERFDITVYPNPVRTSLKLAAENTIMEYVWVVDILGQVVYSNKVAHQHHEINVSGFRNGVYFIQVTTAAGVHTYRVQVTR